jgi:murein DD-endopeptidase MepM/ murein hydrolase activator NlpD
VKFGNPVGGRIGPLGKPDAASGFAVTRAFADGSLPQYGPHDGLDIGNGASGDPIIAMAAGTVYQAFFDSASGGAGIVRVDHGDGWTTGYAHMDTLYVSAGQNVKAGAQIGRLDNTGWSSGAHLHFDTSEGSQRRDPWPLLEQNQPGKVGDVDILGDFERTTYGERFRIDDSAPAALHTEPAADSPTLEEYPQGTIVPGIMIVSNEGADWYVAVLYVAGRGYCLGYIHEKEVSPA